jgi:hypothetical protein
MTYSMQDAAQDLGVAVAAVRAIAEVESAGSGMNANGVPKILFEAHHFSRLTKRRYDKSNPNISSPTWNRKLYKGGDAEHGRLQEAAALDRDAALQSASWGRFQIMGFHWQRLGYPSVQAFVNDMYAGEDGQLRAFTRFIKTDKALHAALKALDWKGVALRYNGSGYAANKYDQKLAQAYARFSK